MLWYLVQIKLLRVELFLIITDITGDCNADGLKAEHRKELFLLRSDACLLLEVNEDWNEGSLELRILRNLYPYVNRCSKLVI